MLIDKIAVWPVMVRIANFLRQKQASIYQNDWQSCIATKISHDFIHKPYLDHFFKKEFSGLPNSGVWQGKVIQPGINSRSCVSETSRLWYLVPISNWD